MSNGPHEPPAHLAGQEDRPLLEGRGRHLATKHHRRPAHFHPDVAEAVLDAAHNGSLNVVVQDSMYRDAPAIGAFENPVA